MLPYSVWSRILVAFSNIYIYTYERIFNRRIITTARKEDSFFASIYSVLSLSLLSLSLAFSLRVSLSLDSLPRCHFTAIGFPVLLFLSFSTVFTILLCVLSKEKRIEREKKRKSERRGEIFLFPQTLQYSKC